MAFGLYQLSFDVPSRALKLACEQLFDEIVPAECKSTVMKTKVDVTLVKKRGARWSSLEKKAAEPVVSPSSSTGPAAATESLSSSSASLPSDMAQTGTSVRVEEPKGSRARNKWDNLDLDEERAGEKDGQKGEGNDELQGFFQKLYADADDDTRKAMMKSYQESGGTHLSTNWSEVKKGKVETKPPEGMEARKW